MKRTILFSKNIYFTFPLLFISFFGFIKEKRPKHLPFSKTIIFLILFTLFINNKINAQVLITKPNLTIPVCSGFPTAYNTLGNIVIDENNNNDSDISNGTNRTIILTAPSNFEFNPGVGSVDFNPNQDIQSASISVTTSTITITYTTDANDNDDRDRLTILEIEVRAINSASTGNITRTGGNATINNLPIGTTLTNILASNTGCLIYCTPTYSNGPGNGNSITNVTLGTLINISGASADPFYTFYNSVTIPNLTPSTIANVSITFGSNNDQWAGVWIDFNQDGVFQTSEGFVSIANAGSNGTTTITITVPAGALSGNTRMRVRGGENNQLIAADHACGTSSSNRGETEDYIVNIIASGPPTITSLGATSSCVGGSITINGTNLTGATAAGVTIGGTAVSSITSNTATQIVAVIGAGTTGTVSVTTPRGTTTSAASFTVNPLPTANAGTALAAICKNSTTVTLGGSVSGSAIGGIWSSNVAGGTFVNNTGSTPNTTTWTPPTGYVGTATLTLTTTGGTCGTTTASKTQLIQEPTANAGNVLTAICQGGSTTALNGSFGGSATSAVWSTISGGTFANNTGSTPATATWTPPAGFTGTATLVLTTAGGSCGTTTASKTQDINVPPSTATVGSNQSALGLVSIALGGNTPTTGTGTWSKTSGTGTVNFSAINSGASTATVTAYGTYVLRWTISNAPCTASFAEITVIYTAPPAPEINIIGGTTSIIDGANSPNTTDLTDFGTTAIGVGITQTFTIENTGLGPLAVGAITFTGVTGTDFSVSVVPNTTVASASNTTFIVTFTPSGTGTRNAVINIANDDSNENPYNFSIRGTGDITLTKGPGGVITPLQLWLRADLLNGTTSIADNTAVSTWNTQAKGTNATKPAAVGAPVYKNNATANINFNAVVDFTNNYTTAPQVYTDNDPTRQYLKGASGFYSRDIFAVVMPDVTMTSAIASNDIFCGDRNSSTNETDGTGIGYGSYTNRFTDEVLTYAVGTTTGPGNGYGVAQIGTGISYSTAGIINASNNATGNGTNLSFNANNLTTSISDAGGFATVSNSQYWIGRSEGWDGSLDGRVAEIITLDTRATDAQRSNIQSYLAIKYGITLGVNGTSINYTNSDGNTIWNRNTGIAINDVFNFDIAGIGRDDISKLNQKQSKSINTADDITIGLTDIYTTNTANTNTFDTDKKFLVWGNNHGTLAAQPAVIVDISSGITPAITPDGTKVSFISVGRTWKVLETGGNVATTKISIPSIMLTATITPPGDYLMFISNTPNFDPTAEYRVMRENGANLETTYDFDGTKYITFGYAPEVTRVRCIKFNGTTDYMDAGKVLNLNSSFTVSAWINKNNNNFNKTILSKRNSSFTEGYDLGINATGRAEMSWYSGGTKKTITSNAIIPIGKWHHIGVTFDGTTAKIYVDGVNKISSNLSGIPSTTTESFLIAAANGTTPTSFFNGSIDEVRVWKSSLTEAQFRLVMNQEIQQDASKTSGAVIPPSISQNDIGIVDWTQLNAYYPMTTYTYTNAKDKSSYGLTAALRNLKTVDRQTAPLPYESAADGLWQTSASWMNNSVQNLPYSASIEDPLVTPFPPAPPGLPVTIDWNIVRIKNNHTITSVGDKKVLGLFIEPNANLIATTTGGLQTDGTKIEVSHYLKLDGKIDLVGRSQLVQKLGSDLDPTSSGSIERDQQGQANKFNYNYWGSPVGTINATTNNDNFTVAGVLRDGTNPGSLGTINWIPGYDGSLTTPISLAGYWIYKFDSNLNATDYANWTQIGETGTLQAGKGFTLKGPGISGTQNLTFTGKPNNGTITNTVGSDQLLLVGNPYPSALDADQFIMDNISSIETSTTVPAIDGALYFWEHYPSNNSHNLGAYLGGYGIRNLAGGVPPSSLGVDFINTTGISSRPEPKRYIPVGQGFFVIGKIGSGGKVTFNNSQREFVKEDDASFSQTTYRIPTTPKIANHWTYTSTAPIQKDMHKKVHLGFNFHNQSFHRQVLLAFMDEKANSEMNDGYDAYNIDDSPSDMYLLNGENELAIQGEGYFDEEASYPIGVRSDSIGKISFVLDGLENFDESQNIFIHDNETDTYHSIKDKAYEIELPAGTFNERFSLRFTDKSLAVQDASYDNAITVFFTRSNNTLNIKNSANDNTVLTASLFNIQGKLLSKWDVKEKEQSNIKIPIQDKSSAVYIVKLKTEKGNISKKIIIK
jgi:hypothetical protein